MAGWDILAITRDAVWASTHRFSERGGMVEQNRPDGLLMPNCEHGPAYNSAAACDAWNRTLAWFNKFLRPPAA